MRIIVVLVLLSAALVLASRPLRPAITTHLLVFALGALYGGVVHRKKSRRKVKVPRDRKGLGYRTRQLPEAAPQTRFVKLTRRHDW